MVEIEIRDARPYELPVAAAVLSRGMRDNPLHLSVLGPEPEDRQKKLEHFFHILLAWMPHALWVGILHGTIVAVCGMSEPGRCQPTFSQKLNIVTRLAHHFGVASTLRALRWFGEWGLRDPKEAHWHLGPVGVDAHLQGQGIGSQLIGEWCKLLDAHRAAGYLETDKGVNAGFYEKFGFETISEAKVLGTPNWFMLRAARSRDKVKVGCPYHSTSDSAAVPMTATNLSCDVQPSGVLSPAALGYQAATRV
jgi:GNAT superfamily N-acetyltransferase